MFDPRALQLPPGLEPEQGFTPFQDGLDTETTGLSGGTGTLPFLIGTARFEDDGRFLVEQLFLRRPGEEAPMLHWLASQLAATTCLVTYNGKSFDWPLLRSRFVMNRVPVPPLPPHLDLLHCARRVFARRNLGARLTDTRKRLTDQGFQITPLTSEKFAAFIRPSGRNGPKLVKDLGIPQN